MEDFNVFIVNDSHLHYHYMPTRTADRICVDVMHFEGQIFMVSWYGIHPYSTGSVNLTEKFKFKNGGK